MQGIFNGQRLWKRHIKIHLVWALSDCTYGHSRANYDYIKAHVVHPAIYFTAWRSSCNSYFVTIIVVQGLHFKEKYMKCMAIKNMTFIYAFLVD